MRQATLGLMMVMVALPLAAQMVTTSLTKRMPPAGRLAR